MPEKHTRKLTVTGSAGTYYVTLPKEIVKGLRWKKGQKMVVTREKDSIVIKDWRM